MSCAKTGTLERREENRKIDRSVFTEKEAPAVGFGPGDERFVHSDNEVLSVNDLPAATKVYALLAADICGMKCSKG